MASTQALFCHLRIFSPIIRRISECSQRRQYPADRAIQEHRSMHGRLSILDLIKLVE
jgi:hypothetical protein